MSNEDKKKQPEPNAVLVSKRDGSSRAKLAAELEAIGMKLRNTSTARFSLPSRAAIEKQVYRLERGFTKHPDELYKKLYCIRYNASPHELFGDLAQPTPHSAAFRFRNRKLIPAFVGADLAERSIRRLAMEPEPGQLQLPHCYRCALSHPRSGVVATLRVWPFGVAMFHVFEDIGFSDLASLAVWHRSAYDEQMAWAHEQTQALLDSSAPVQYAMPVNWLMQSPWCSRDLETALRILSMPRILLRRDHASDGDDLAHAQLVERSLFREGLDHPDVIEFGVKSCN